MTGERRGRDGYRVFRGQSLPSELVLVTGSGLGGSAHERRQGATEGPRRGGVVPDAACFRAVHQSVDTSSASAATAASIRGPELSGILALVGPERRSEQHRRRGASQAAPTLGEDVAGALQVHRDHGPAAASGQVGGAAR